MMWLKIERSYSIRPENFLARTYALLGATPQLLNRAIDEMVQYYRDDEFTLARELRWMGILLRRADIIPLEDKRMIEERLSMYDDLMENDPKMQRIRAESRAEGEVKGRAEGEVKGRRKELQIVILAFVQGRFPALIEQTQQKIKHVATVDELSELCLKLINVTDEAAARKLLTS